MGKTPLHELLRSDRISHYKVDGKCLIPGAELAKFLASYEDHGA